MNDFEYDCPSCGSDLVQTEDIYGRVYQCHDMTCMQMYDASEIEEEFEEEG